MRCTVMMVSPTGENNKVWSDIAFNHPLVHAQTGTKIHLVGIHHNSVLSLERAKESILKLRPAMVMLELDAQRFRAVSDKAKVYLNPNSKEAAQISRIIGISSNESQHQTKAATSGSEQSVDQELLYSLEMGTALETAREIGACIKLIDIQSETLIEMDANSTHSSFISSARREFKLPIYRNDVEQSFVSYLLEWVAKKLIFFKCDVNLQIKEDRVGLQDFSRYLHLHEIFHPTDSFYLFKFRNAVMLQNLKGILKQLASGMIPINSKLKDKLRSNETGKDFGLKDNETKPPRNIITNEFDPKNSLDIKTIVIVMGKGHYFGFQQLWNQYNLKNVKYPIRPSKIDFIDTDDILMEDKVKLSTSKFEEKIHHTGVNPNPPTIAGKTSKGFTYLD